MKPFNALCLSVTLALGAGGSTALAQTPTQDPSTSAAGQHLSDAAAANPALANSFRRLMQPFAAQSDWLTQYGVTAPATSVTIDNTQYTVYWGCKPHDCISETYTILVDPTSQKLLAGAFVRNHFNNGALSHSNISWLGDAQWDFAKALLQPMY